MMKEAKSQTKVGVGIESLWTAFAKDFTSTILKTIPNLVNKCEVLEGDGGLGTIFLVEFGSEKTRLGYQKEKVAVFDESLHQFGMQVMEGGHLNHGFSSYTTVFQLTATGESETVVDIKVLYEIEADDHNHMPEETIKAALGFIKCLEEYLSKQGHQL